MNLIRLIVSKKPRCISAAPASAIRSRYSRRSSRSAAVSVPLPLQEGTAGKDAATRKKNRSKKIETTRV